MLSVECTIPSHTPDLVRLISWASLDSIMLCCWMLSRAGAAWLTVLMGWLGSGDVDAGSELLAKQIKHLPANRGLWFGSRSLPQSGTLLMTVTVKNLIHTFADFGQIFNLMNSGMMLKQFNCKKWFVANSTREARVSCNIMLKTELSWGWQFYGEVSCGDSIWKLNEVIPLFTLLHWGVCGFSNQ